MDTMYNALQITELNGNFIKEIKRLPVEELPDNDVLVKVNYSSVNYKDALSASGNKGVTRKFPHVPGIDAAGIVIKSKIPELAEGDKVIVTGFDLGMNTWGGFGEYINVPASWVMHLPGSLSLQEAMIFGTAGLTAGLSVNQIVNAGILPQKGPIAVSGATGGVGSIAVAILNQLGYSVTAISGKNDDKYLCEILGARQIIGRDEFTETYNNKAMATPAFAAGIDTVGGSILSGMLKATQYGGTVTCCGMVSSADLDTSIFPFILRGITLAGIDSVMAPMPLRKQIWQQLSTGWKPNNLESLMQEIRLADLPEKLDELLKGQAKGRYVLVHG